MINEKQIACGKCNCKYYPRLKYYSSEAVMKGLRATDECIVDSSCPQCGFGNRTDKQLTEVPKQQKKLLLS